MSDCRCDGSGAIVHVSKGSDEWVPIGTGLEMRNGGGHSTELCPCRKSLPSRDGEAQWWVLETETIAEIEFLVFDEYANVVLSCEVPVSDANYRLHRTPENMYWPTQVQLEVSDTNLNWLSGDDARALGEALIRAADRVAELDDPPALSPTPESV